MEGSPGLEGYGQERQFICSQVCPINSPVLKPCVSLSPASDSQQFTLDLNTVNKLLRLSKRNRVITFTGTVQTYPDHPDRFDEYHQAAVKESEMIFSDLIRSIKKNRSDVTRLIRDQERAVVSQTEGLLERLEQEIADLRRKNAELEQLKHTDDHIHFLKGFQYLSAPLEPTERITVTSPLSVNDVRQSICQLREKIEKFCKEEIKRISVKHINIVLRTRKDFLQHSHQFTFDPNTVNKHIHLSERNRLATYTDTVQRYPDHPDRFDVYYQVLCGESVHGCCYWEVECNGDVGISVSYKHISRKGTDTKCLFGYNDQSWSLDCSSSSYSFRHNNIQTRLPIKSISRRIGVFVDHSAGTLSFYSVSDTMSLIHTVRTTFTQPLYPGFNVGLGSSVKLD
ncbi:tripartite motif-containing protein 16-like protein [Sinocyclocheilus anshuiensis]|uniref:tripartite motif-containing protein 16-like protein n=1 Tax=Sinocyclocheilus anshuiensis TaxID=1608454 RepID=UPI0007BA3643|nr:PREDICTED: tripartite motif-containing protein 16-like protein [Sinocyclocheilus anshuiensis]